MRSMETAIGKIRRTFGTHSGAFHADEVTACALLLHFEMIDRDQIIRTRDMARLDSCDFVCDVGGVYAPDDRRFDHHQSSYEGGLSSAGMVWKYLRKENIVSSELYHYFLDQFIKGVDEIDNGKSKPVIGHASFSQVVSSFVPPSYEATEEEFNRAFDEALEFVLGYIGRMERKFKYIEGCKEEVKEIMEKMHECLVFDKPMSWLEPFFALGGDSHPAEFLIMPTGSHWKLRGIPPTYERRMEVRRPLPEEWAGLLMGDLEKVTNIPGSIFCHKGRFVSVWATKEAAMKALKYVLSHKEREEQNG